MQPGLLNHFNKFILRISRENKLIFFIKQNYNQRIVSMSLAKKKSSQRSQNSSISQVSNSENLRDSSLFKNQYLSEIQNIHIVDPTCQSQRKQQSEVNSIKRKVTTQMKEQQVKTKQSNDKSKQNKIINYTGLAKILDERNLLISNQEKQIEGLKSSLDRVKRELQSTRIEFDNKKIQDFASLKRQQKENEENIKELQILRVGVRQLKGRIENLEHEKELLQKKNSQYLQQNQQLTIKMTSLKEQYLSRIPDQKAMADLKSQLSVMKEQVKLTKQFEIQKASLEQRCRNFQKKINEYIIRYNQVQGDYNEAQIKYYRAQKQNDDLKMNIEELEIQNKNIRKMLQQQKKILNEQTQKWKIRLSRLEDHQKNERNFNHLQTKIVINQIQDRCVRLEQLSAMEQKIQSKNLQITNLIAKNTAQTAEIQSLNNQLGQMLTENLKIKQNIEMLMRNNTQQQRSKSMQMEQIRRSYQQYQECSKMEINGLQQKIKVLQAQIVMLRQNIENLEGKVWRSVKEGEQTMLKNIKQTQQNRRKWSLSQMQMTQMKQKIDQLNKQNDEKSKYICSIMSRNTDLASDLRQLNELIGIKNKQIQQYQLNLSKKAKDHTRIHQQLNERVRQVELTKSMLTQKTKDVQIINNLLKQRIRQVEQLEHRIGQLNSHLQFSQNSLKQKQTELLIKQSQLRRKQEQISDKNSIVLLRQSQKTNFFYELSCKTKQISQLQNMSYQLKDEIRQLKIRLNEYKTKNEQKQATWSQKINQLQRRRQQLQSQLENKNMELENKNGELSKKQIIINNTNTQLREIKIIVQSYKQKIQDCSNTIIEADRKLYNQQYLTQENLFKLEEEIKYFKAKYQETFRESLDNSNKLHEVQRHLTEQINKNTELLKINCELQSQLSSCRTNLQGKQSRQIRQMEQLANQNKRIKAEASSSQMMLNNAKIRLRQYQNIGKQLQNKIIHMTNEIIRIKQQQQNNINIIKIQYMKNIQEKEHKHQQDIAAAVQTEKIRHHKEINGQIERQRHLGAKLQEALKQISHKDSIIQTNYQILSTKQQQLQSIFRLKQKLQNQQITKIKEYNIKLSQQIQEMSQQYNQNYHQLRQTVEQCQKFKQGIVNLQKQNCALLTQNSQLNHEITSIKSEIFDKSEENLRIVGEMRCQIAGYEQKIKCQTQEINVWMQKYQMSQKQLKKVQNQVNKVSRSYLEESTRKNRQSNRQIEGFRTQIQLLQEENLNLQKVMDKQLGKRKLIIEQLISQKKMLYEQIGHH